MLEENPNNSNESRQELAGEPKDPKKIRLLTKKPPEKLGASIGRTTTAHPLKVLVKTNSALVLNKFAYEHNIDVDCLGANILEFAAEKIQSGRMSPEEMKSFRARTVKRFPTPERRSPALPKELKTVARKIEPARTERALARRAAK